MTETAQGKSTLPIWQPWKGPAPGPSVLLKTSKEMEERLRVVWGLGNQALPGARSSAVGCDSTIEEGKRPVCLS